MSFIIYVKKEIGNNISRYLNIPIKQFTTETLDISNGLLTKGAYKIPIEHILFIEEV
jgi:hypothetical protein